MLSKQRACLTPTVPPPNFAFPSTARHAACSWRVGCHQGAASRLPGYRISDSTPANAHKAAPWLCAFVHRPTFCTAAASPRRRPAINPLAGLRLADGCLIAGSTAPSRYAPRLHRPCYGCPGIAVLGLGWLGCVRSADCAVSFAHGFVGYARNPWSVRCAQGQEGHSGVNTPLRYIFNITAPYAKSGQSLRRLRLMTRPLPRPSGSHKSCYVSRPGAS